MAFTEAISNVQKKKLEVYSVIRPHGMRGYIFVTPEGFDTDDDLSYWLDLCLAFNPLAKASKPKKKK